MESQPQISLRMKRITSFGIWFCSFSFGVAYNFLSPSLVELKNKYHTDIDGISEVFTYILLAYLVGALVCGILFDYLSRQLIMVTILYIMAAGVIIIPFLPTKTLFFIAGAVIGFAGGGFDTSQVVWMLEMWQGEAGVYVQTQYFSFALGTFVAPLLLRPYLLTEAYNDEDGYSTTTTTESPYPDNYTLPESKSELYIPLSIGGGIIVLASSFVLFLYFYDKYIPPTKRANPQVSNSSSTAAIVTDISDSDAEPVSNNKSLMHRFRSLDSRRVILTGLSAVLLGCYQGMEISTFQFLPTFSHYIDLRLPEPDGAWLLSGLTGAFTLGRFLGIFIMYSNVKPALVLVANFIISVAGNVVLLVWSNDSLTFLWLGTVLLGFGYSTIFACVYDHIEKHLKITNLVGATMVIAGGLVSAIYPLILGSQVEKKPYVMSYTIFFSLFMCSVAFSCIYYLTIIKKKKQVESGDNCDSNTGGQTGTASALTAVTIGRFG